QGPASLQPIWEQGRLTLAQTSAATEIGDTPFAASLSALKSQMIDFLEDLGYEDNIDRRFISFLRVVVERTPDKCPTQPELFSLGHQEEVFKRYFKTVKEQWPDFLVSRYEALLSQFDLTMRQSPLWREFKHHGTERRMSPGQIAAAGVVAVNLAKALQEHEAAEIVDPVVPQSLVRLAEAAPVET